jgi:hypothetical protein
VKPLSASNENSDPFNKEGQSFSAACPFLWPQSTHLLALPVRSGRVTTVFIKTRHFSFNLFVEFLRHHFCSSTSYFDKSSVGDLMKLRRGEQQMRTPTNQRRLAA